MRALDRDVVMALVSALDVDVLGIAVDQRNVVTIFQQFTGDRAANRAGTGDIIGLRMTTSIEFIVAALAVYAPIVYPMRKLIRQAPPADEPDQPDQPGEADGPKTQGRHRRPDAETPATR